MKNRKNLHEWRFVLSVKDFNVGPRCRFDGDREMAEDLDSVVVLVHNIQPALCADCHTLRCIELTVAVSLASPHSQKRSRWGELLNAMVVHIADVHVVGCIGDDITWVGELPLTASIRTPATEVSASWGELLNAMVPLVGNVDFSIAVNAE